LVLDSTKDSPDLFLPGREYLVLPVLLLLGTGVTIVVLARLMPARTKVGAQTLAMALAYRNTLRYELARAATMNEAVAGTQSRLPWITTPDELTVWSVAFGLSKAVDALVKRSLATDATPGTAWAPLWYSGSAASVGDVGGMVGESVNAMARYRFAIVEEFAVKISHSLMMSKKGDFSDVDTVMTHPQVLAQCHTSLKTKYPALRQTSGEGDLIDHAKVAELLGRGALASSIATMGSRVLADIHGLRVIEDNLQDLDENFTSFLWVQRPGT